MKSFFKIIEKLDWVIPFLAKALLFVIMCWLALAPYFGVEPELSNVGLFFLIALVVWIEGDSIKDRIQDQVIDVDLVVHSVSNKGEQHSEKLEPEPEEQEEKQS